MDSEEAKPNGAPALDRSWAFRRTAAVAVAATALGIGLAVWTGQSTRVVRVVVAVRPNGRGNLFVTDLAPAPQGKTYEAWIVSKEGSRPAGLFAGARGTVLVRLPGRLSTIERVVVTLEPAGGVQTLTQLSGAHKAVFDVHI
jgi:anti-sigma-K factor RskA